MLSRCHGVLTKTLLRNWEMWSKTVHDYCLQSLYLKHTHCASGVDDEILNGSKSCYQFSICWQSLSLCSQVILSISFLVENLTVISNYSNQETFFVILANINSAKVQPEKYPSASYKFGCVLPQFCAVLQLARYNPAKNIIKLCHKAKAAYTAW